MQAISLIYPHQLYEKNPVCGPERLHILLEDPLFFGDKHHPARFHKMKLMLHRAAMRRYEKETLQAAGYQTRYVPYADLREDPVAWLARLKAEGCEKLYIVDPCDDLVGRRLRRWAAELNLEIIWADTPNFLTSHVALGHFWKSQKPNHYHQTNFYIWQRQRMDILLDADKKPVGERWTFDTENRQKLKDGVALPSEPSGYDNQWIREARSYVEANFASNPGRSDTFIYPTSHAEARTVLRSFLTQRLEGYGPYQDAISQRGPFLFHSLLSAPLNCGLLTPHEIIEETLAYHAAHPHISLASVEGFIRQIIGWREFIRAVYLKAGVQQRTSNFFQHYRPLDERWYTGETGIQPVDDAIRKSRDYAYAHHIERLMLIGNIMVLCEIHPDEVYRWFMEMYIDAYDWVMVSNVYGMSQYADGGLMTTKPYISSSNYVRKMSDYKQGDWASLWDALYWRFIHKHQDFFKGNARLAMMTSHLKRMSDADLQAHQHKANQFLNTLGKPLS